MTSTELFYDCDVVLLTETFIDCDSFQVSNYVVFGVDAKHCDGAGRPSGGLIGLFSQSLSPTLVSKNDSCLTVRTNNFISLLFYFVPDESVADIILVINQELTKVNDEENILVAGDFNCRIDQGNRGKTLIEHLITLGFELVNNTSEKTYISPQGESLIDLLFIKTNRGDHSKGITRVHCDPIRKHQRIVLNWKLVKRIPEFHITQQKKLSRRLDLFKLANLTDLTKADLILKQGHLENGNNIILNIIQSCAINRELKHHHHKPWFNNDCKIQKRKVFSLMKNRNSSSLARSQFWLARKEYKSLIKRTREEYEDRKLLEKIEQTEITPWTLFNDESKKSQRKPAPILMNELKQHFIQMFQKSNDKNLHYKYTDTTDNDENIAWYNSPISENEVKSAIMNAPNHKATGHDLLSYEHLKQSLDIMLPLWTTFLNLCFNQGDLPKSWLESILKLIYKGKGCIRSPDNYRGIALNCIPFKVLTCILNKRIFAKIRHLLPDEQYGFVPKRSTCQPIQQLINDINDNLKDGKHMYCCFVDFRKAFDSLNRRKLLEKLEKKFGIKGKTYHIIQKILSSNSVRINNGDLTSEPIEQTVGVLQGDCL